MNEVYNVGHGIFGGCGGFLLLVTIVFLGVLFLPPIFMWLNERYKK